jgi:hypothetical protein
MTSLHTIFLLNTTAIAAYESGENECAATKLIEALRLLPTVLSKGNMADTRMVDAETNQHETLPKEQNQYGDSSVYSVHPKYACSQDTIIKSLCIADDYHHGCMYRGAFVNSSEYEANESTAIMLYNLALVMHTEGMKRNRVSALYRADSFYRQAVGFLMTASNNYKKSFSLPSIYVLIGAIQTNLSQIANELYQSSHAANETTVDQLVQLILRMEDENSIRRQDIEFFQRAVTFISLTNLDLAPAA